MAITLETLEQYFQDSVEATDKSRHESEMARDYYDGIQLTREQITELKRRKQPPVVFNRIQPKIDFLLGTERKSRTDPKAFPRTPQHDEAAFAATDGIRYVADNNNFQGISSNVFENELIEGTGGVAVEVDKENLEITIKRFPWDRYFYDPHSREKCFSDIRYDGIVIWMDADEAKEKWPNSAENIDTQMNLHRAGETFDDKPSNRIWFDSSRKRVMIVQMNFREDGIWKTAIFAKGTVIEDIQPSAYLDEFGKPENPLIKVSPKVDREGQRYGAVKNLIDIQDEINKRRSKALHILNSRQTFSKSGMLTDIRQFKSEANKPDGHLEFPPQGTFGHDFGIVPDSGLGASQFQMYQESIQQMDSISANAALAGDTDQGLSGRAVQSLQQGGMLELGPLFDEHAQWKKRVYRAIWNRIKQFWKEDKWIRVTDDEDNLKWVGLNQPVSAAEQAVMEKTGLALGEVKQQFGAQIDQVAQQDPSMAQTVKTENQVAEIDVDIILEESPDIINLQGEQFDLLVKMYQANPKGPQNPEGVPWQSVIEMSTLRNKEKVLGKDNPQEEQAQQEALQQAQQQQQMVTATELEKTQSETLKNNAQAEKTTQEATQKQIENALILANPGATNVSI